MPESSFTVRFAIRILMIWTVQLEHFINQHPELDHEQRSVVYDAFGSLAAGAMEGNPTSEDFSAKTLSSRKVRLLSFHGAGFRPPS
jgi:hypothetical protein